eukprot:gene2258-2473_t
MSQMIEFLFISLLLTVVVFGEETCSTNEQYQSFTSELLSVPHKGMTSSSQVILTANRWTLCPYHTDAGENTYACYFTLCPQQEIVVSLCGRETGSRKCSGNPFVQLKDATGKLFAPEDSACSEFCSYRPRLSNCATFHLLQGCLDHDSCGGQAAIYLAYHDSEALTSALESTATNSLTQTSVSTHSLDINVGSVFGYHYYNSAANTALARISL